MAFGLFGGTPLTPWLAVLALILFALFIVRPMRGSRASGTRILKRGGQIRLLDHVRM